MLFLSLSRSADRVDQGITFSAEKALQQRNEEVLRMQVKNVNPQLNKSGGYYTANRRGGMAKTTATTQYLQNLID